MSHNLLIRVCNTTKLLYQNSLHNSLIVNSFDCKYLLYVNLESEMSKSQTTYKLQRAAICYVSVINYTVTSFIPNVSIKREKRHLPYYIIYILSIRLLLNSVKTYPVHVTIVMCQLSICQF